jgi:hypothetical protein
LEEIDKLIDNYEVNNLEIEDDNFTLKRDRTLEILEGIIERNSAKNIEKFIGQHIMEFVLILWMLK